MGTNNRQRRAAKARKRSRRQRPREQPRNRTEQGGFGSWENATCDCFDCRLEIDPAALIRGISGHLLSVISRVWRDGWQPSELVRQIRKGVSKQAAELVTVAVLVDDMHRCDQTKHPHWQRQIDRLARTVDEREIADDWLERHVGIDPPSRDVLIVVDSLLAELSTLGPLLRLIPPPGETTADVDGRSDDADTGDPILERVRALLAQAESTSFPAEAEAFTAKAQALMSRHAIDEAMIRHVAGVAGRPITVRLPIDDPYTSEKAGLLHVVADAGRCRAIHLSSYAMATVTGDEGDVRRVELLFTSLLLQAQAALNHEASQGGAGSHRRSRSFRSAFLAGYASRIGGRLLAERDLAESESGAEVLPVLARQTQAVDDEIDRLYGDELTSGQGRSRDLVGWSAGIEAANRARLAESGLDTGTTSAEVGRLAGVP